VECGSSSGCEVAEKSLVEASYGPSPLEPLSMEEQRIRRSNLPDSRRSLLLADVKTRLLADMGEGMRQASSISDQLNSMVATQAR